MAVTSKVSMPGRGEHRDRVAGRQPGSALAPALAERQAVPDVDGRDEPVGAVAGDQRRGEVRIAQERRSRSRPCAAPVPRAPATASAVRSPPPISTCIRP